jgi:hypothetical protein
MGIRGMTWFLFGRYGTPAVLAVLSRETLTYGDEAGQPARPPQDATPFREAVAALKAETAWFREEGRILFELVTLPVFQLLAAAINFLVILVRGEPAFSLPFRSLDDVLAAAPGSGGEAGARTRRRNNAPAVGGTP